MLNWLHKEWRRHTRPPHLSPAKMDQNLILLQPQYELKVRRVDCTTAERERSPFCCCSYCPSPLKNGGTSSQRHSDPPTHSISITLFSSKVVTVSLLILPNASALKSNNMFLNDFIYLKNKKVNKLIRWMAAFFLFFFFFYNFRVLLHLNQRS